MRRSWPSVTTARPKANASTPPTATSDAEAPAATPTASAVSPRRRCPTRRPERGGTRRPTSRAGPTRHSDETDHPDSPALKERAMSQTLTDSTGAEVTVALDEDSRSYAIAVEGGAIAGHAYFLPGPEAETERIFHHTVVDEQFG